MERKSKRSKYEQIFELMMKQYPMTVSENYQNKNSLNKDRITEKQRPYYRKTKAVLQQNKGRITEKQRPYYRKT